MAGDVLVTTVSLEHRIKLEGVNTAIDYDEYCFCDCLNQPKSLVQLCATKLVSDCCLLRPIEYIPQSLMSTLITVALFHNRLPSVKYLLDNWPTERFVLEMPPSLKTWEIFYLQKMCKRFKAVVSRFCAAVFGVARHVSMWIKSGLSKRLCYIDLGEFPLSDNLVEKLCLAVNERRMRYHHRPPDQHKYTIKMVCNLLRKTTIGLLTALLQEEQCNKNSDLSIIIHGLHFCSDAFSYQLFGLLDLLDREELKVISCEHCYLPSNTNMMYSLFKYLKKFHHLEAFDMSYTGMDLQRNPHMTFQLNLVFREFMHLKRLDMSHCRLTDNLEKLIGSLYHEERSKVCCKGENLRSRGRLQHLALSSCSLSSLDLNYLRNSPHAKTLVYLKLNGNRLPSKEIVNLLQACKQLKVLEMDRCIFDVEHVREVFNALAEMPKLSYLNINKCNIMDDLQLCLGPKFVNIPTLQVLVVANPNGREMEQLQRYQPQVTEHYRTLKACKLCSSAA